MHKIIGGEWRAIRPTRSGTQVENPGESIRRNFPALGYTRDRLGGFFIERREPLEKGDGEVLVGAGANELWIEILRFGAVTEVEDTVTVSGDDARLAWVATAEKKSGEEKQKDRDVITAAQDILQEMMGGQEDEMPEELEEKDPMED